MGAAARARYALGMRILRIPALTLAAVLLGAGWTAAAADSKSERPPVLTDKTYESVRDHVVPTEEELAFRSAGWLPSFWEAVVRGHEEEKPILLWAMNGHPLGCT